MMGCVTSKKLTSTDSFTLIRVNVKASHRRKPQRSDFYVPTKVPVEDVETRS
jgi:hypothetical protein